MRKGKTVMGLGNKIALYKSEKRDGVRRFESERHDESLAMASTLPSPSFLLQELVYVQDRAAQTSKNEGNMDL